MKRPIAIGVHIFAGGFTLGVRDAGIEVACHLESSKYGVSTAEANLSVPVFWPASSWPLDVIASDPAGVDVVFGNPPCAIFSNMGVTHDAGPGSQAWRSDPRTNCWWDVFRVAEALQPRVFLLESVTEAYTTGRPLVDEMTRKALDLGYSVSHVFVNSRWHGCAQERRRFFLIAHRAAQFDPEPVDFAAPPLTVGDALKNVTDPGPYSAPGNLVEFAQQTPLGGSVSEAYDAHYAQVLSGPPRNALGKRAGRPSFQDRRLDPAKQSFVVAGDKLWHPDGNRRLGTHEYKALCGFPEWFEPQGPPSGHASLLARGLMPPVAAWVGRGVVRTLSAPDDVGAQTVRRLDFRSPNVSPVSLTAEYAPGGARSRADQSLDPVVAQQPHAEALPAVTSDKRPARTPRVAPLSVQTELAVLSADESPPRPGEGSGKYMQRLLLAGVSGDECVARVHKYFAGRTTKRGDAYYNYGKLKSSGKYPDLPPWRAQ